MNINHFLLLTPLKAPIIKTFLFPCPFRHYFHIDCPGCGFQRSMVALFTGDLPLSLSMYPATIPILLLLGLTFLHLAFHVPHGAQLIKYLQLLTGIIILVFYIYKLVTLKAFM